MENIQRPSSKESDEDLLKQQELFFRDKHFPSSKVKLKSSESRKKAECLLEDKHEELQQHSMGQDAPENISEKDSNRGVNSKTDDDICVVENDFLFSIKEHYETFSEPFMFEPPCSTSEPESLSKKFSNKKPKSIFAQSKIGKSSHPKNYTHVSKIQESILIDGSGLAQAAKEAAKRIHEENLAKMAAMSEEEILKSQRQLKEYLSPDIIRFIQSKKKNIAHKSIKREEEEIILRKEGSDDRDAIILENTFHSDVSQKEECSFKNPQTENADISVPEEAEYLLEGSQKGYWKNMDKIEKEKLEWMTPLPKPKPVDVKTGYAARFDFEGKLLSREGDIPMHKGLHHHGQEPEVAGYSLEELFLLARSTVQSQRIMALQTIAHILDNYWYGMMDGCFDNPLLSTMLQSGIVPLLRWAVDDTTITSVSAAVSAIHSLLICKGDEICLHRTFCWLNGHTLPHLEPQGLEEPNIVLEELTDADLIKLDVIKGLLRIDILPRFRYLLEVLCPPPPVCQLILEICSHLAQHSTDSAKKVASHPGLLKFIFKKFLPLSWNFVDTNQTDTVNYVNPFQAAMKLARILASSSKQIAFLLIEKYGLLLVIKCYLSIQPDDGKLPLSDVQNLMVESLKTWRILLCYGFAADVYLDLFPIILRQTEFCQSLSLKLGILPNYEYAAHVFTALQGVILVASEYDLNSETFNVLNWDHVRILLHSAESCLKKWLWEFPQANPSSHGMVMLASCLNFVSTFYERSHKGIVCENKEPCSDAKNIFQKYLIPCLTSSAFNSLLQKLESCSVLLNCSDSGCKRNDRTLISLGSIMWRDDIMPILKEESTFPLLLSILKYVIVYTKLFGDSTNQVYESLLSSEPVIAYLKKISSTKISADDWFTRFEIYFIYQLLELSTEMQVRNHSLWLKVTGSILPCLKTGDEWMVQNIMCDIICKESFLINNNSGCKTDAAALNTESQNAHSATAHLSDIANCYIACLLDKSDLEKSRNILESNISELYSVSILSSRKMLITKDWIYAPIIKLYQTSKLRKCDDSLSHDEILQVKSSLQWILTCNTLESPLIKHIPEAVRFYYLCLVFLLDSDLFREEPIKSHLQSGLMNILQNKSINLEKINWCDIHGYDDLYQEMLIHFEAVSLGDVTFNNFIVYPLQQKFPSRWKKLLLTEHAQALRFLRLSLTQLLIPVQNYLEPLELDVELLTLYCKHLGLGNLNRHCPILYILAVHHLHHFLFMSSDDLIKSQKTIISSVLRFKKKEMAHHVLLYSGVNRECEFGFSIKDSLSSSDQCHLSNIFGQTVHL